MGAMVDAGWGRVVNVSSAASLGTPGPNNSACARHKQSVISTDIFLKDCVWLLTDATSKVAQNHFTRHLAAELEGTGVTANVIHPGDVKTEMWA